MACVVDGVSYPSFKIGGVGYNIRANRKGKLKAEVVQADGSKSTKILSPAKYFKDAKENLLSITAELTAGAKLSSTTNNEIQLVYPDGDTVIFDRRIKPKMAGSVE